MSKLQYIRPKFHIIEMHEIMSGYGTNISEVAVDDSRARYFGDDNNLPYPNAPWSENESTSWE